MYIKDTMRVVVFQPLFLEFVSIQNAFLVVPIMVLSVFPRPKSGIYRYSAKD